MAWYRWGWPIWLLIGLWSNGPARAESIPPDSAQAWLVRGTAALANRQLPMAYRLFAQAAPQPGETGLAAQLAQIHTLLALNAQATARAHLNALPALPAQLPWLRAAEGLIRTEVLPTGASADLRLRTARRALVLVSHLTPARPLRQAQARMALAQAHLMLNQTDSALYHGQRALQLARGAWASVQTEPLPYRAALPPLKPAAFYAVLGQTLMARARTTRPDDPHFAGYCAAADTYFDSARQVAPDSVKAALLWRFRGVNLSQWATATDGPAGDRLAARANACFAQGLRLDRHPAQQALTLVTQAELADRFGEPEQALSLLQRALALLVPATDLHQPTSLPATFGAAAAADELPYLLEQKTAICCELYETSGRLAYLQAYHTHATRLAELLAYRRRLASLGRGASAAALQVGNPLDNYALAVASGTDLYERTRQPLYLEGAFRIAENAKAWRLLARLGSDRPTDLLRADDHLLTAWRRRTEALQQWQEMHRLAAEYPALRLTAEVAHSADSLASAERQLAALAQLLRTRYPALYARTFGGDYALPLPQIQAALPTDGSVVAVEFLRRTSWEDGTGREWVYAFVVRHDSTRLLRLPLPTGFPQTVDSLAAALARPGSRAYPRLAARVYELLLGPVAKILPPAVTQLVVAPDGELWRVPFEALLTERPTVSGAALNYRTLPYALRRWRISYAHSLTLYATQHQQRLLSTPAHLLALAPFVDPADPRGLPFTARLLDRLALSTAGDYLLGAVATPVSFRAGAPASQVLHLATHAEPDMADPRASHLQLAGGKLTLADLFDLNLHPQLVVLSACQTGIGQLTTPSEGLTSLSWGFAYMGAASTVATLWRVDDEATAALLGRFYAGLHQHQSRERALHRAKLAALDSAQTSTAADPFYWAGLVLTGDERPLGLAPAQASGVAAPVRIAIWGALAGVVLLSGVWWWLGKKMRR